MEPTPTFVIELFGTMRVLVDGEPIAAVRSRKSLWLLALLALRSGRPASREWIANTLWPEVDPATAFANLRPALSNLRKALGSEAARIESPDRTAIRLNLDGAQTDVAAFADALKKGGEEALERAVGLYRGALLEGCAEEWAHQERNVMEAQCLQALQTLGDAMLAERKYDRAVDFFTRATALDPWRDAPRRGLMSSLAASGDVNAALHVYRDFARHLGQEGGLRPDEQTTELYRRLRLSGRGRSASEAAPGPSPGGAVRGYLPHAVSSLVGRTDDIADVAGRLRDSRLVTLKGSGGIGKTRLAIAVAGHVASRYPDGAWLVSLESLADDRHVPQQILALMEVPDEAGKAPLSRLAAHLRDKRLLIVLDNCEHLLASCAEVCERLLRECGDVSILATSREALGIFGERVSPVPSLVVPSSEHLPQNPTAQLRVLAAYESVQLFVERARAAQPSFDLTADNAARVARICSALEGVPLALEIAAARARSMSIESIAARLNDHLGLLTQGSRTAASRQRTLRSTIDWSYELLGAKERAFFERLAVFSGGWTLDSAERVATGEPVSVSEVPDLLQSLVDKSIVAFDPSGDRFRLLETVRQYALERLSGAAEFGDVVQRHRRWCVDLAEEAEPLLVGPEQRIWSSRLDPESDNFRAALAGCAEAPEEGLRLAGGLTRFWHLKGRFSEGRERLRESLDRRGADVPSAARAKALNGLGLLANTQSDYESAETCWLQALEIREALEDPAAVAEALSNLGTVTAERRRHDEALRYYERSRRLYEKTDDRLGLAFVLLNIGWIHQERSDFGGALRFLVEAQTIFKQLGHSGMQAWMLQMIAEVRFQRGEFDAARALLEDALDRFREAGNERGAATVLEGLARVFMESETGPHVDELLEESLATFRRHGIEVGVGNALLSLGHASLRRRRPDEAEGRFSESLSTFARVGDPRGEADAIEGLGAAALACGDRAAALRHLRDALAVRHELGARRAIAQCLEWIGAASDDATIAARLWGAAAALRETLGAPRPPCVCERFGEAERRQRGEVGEKDFARLWAEGSRLGLQDAVRIAAGLPST